ncbi:hypothetical protein AXF42_Ash014761 [Apostasia shenzhenica]|uniref:DUF668 domain-containing protein n=1 Tax=Apostasia shenzhenica TaxID=1088818 RepID=A0A2H9ZW77_9ASPA|nr:hypothetical protein AXF42_Ash014761 [Apostasia shenzhenica]
MCKAVHLWQALSDERIGKLRDDAMRLEGVRKLVSEDDDFLLGLVIAEIMDSVRALARSVARLGKWCADPLLQHFEHVIADLVSKASYPYRFEFTGKKMDGEVKKMEKFIAAASNLYQEIEVLADMEGEGLAAFKRRIGWQRQAVKRLQEVSVWNRSYDYTVLLLARSLFTIVGRMKIIFGFQNTNLSLYLLDSKRKLLNAPPSTLGAAALSLHYANIIVTIEKLAMSPISIGPSVRDELYNMLPGSIRMALRMRLRDPALAAEWSDAMTRILEWLSPLAHNMVMWQSARSFEQQRWASSTSVLLIQTLYYANQVKTEAAIAELLVGLNYLWRFGKELNSKAVQDCANGRNLNRSWQTKCKIHTIGR